jgi:hypothetical protein
LAGVGPHRADLAPESPNSCGEPRLDETRMAAIADGVVAAMQLGKIGFSVQDQLF